jgi:hypothetical protein
MGTTELSLVESQLSVVRYPTTHDVFPVMFNLAENFTGPGVQFRPLEEDKEFISPGVRIIHRNDITTRAQILPDIPYLLVKDAIEASVPGLKQEQTVTFAQMRVDSSTGGGSFVVLKPDHEGFATLASERRMAALAIRQVCRMPARKWGDKYLDLTLAHLAQDLAATERGRVANYIHSLLPLTVRLQPALIRPNPSNTSF